MTQQTPFAQQHSYQQPQPVKQLRRSRDDRVVAGICAGVGRYLNIDPVAARVLFVVLAVFSGGTALIAYVIAWLVMPEEPATTWSPATYQPPTYATTPPAEHRSPTADDLSAPAAHTPPTDN